MTHRVVDRKHKHTQQQTNSRDNRQQFAFRFGWARCGFDLGVVDNFERSFVEVAVFVRVRKEEETLGATFHDASEFERFLQDASRLLED